MWLIRVATHPEISLLGQEPGTQVFRELGEHPADQQFPGSRRDSTRRGLFFATSDTLEDRIRQVIHSTPSLTGIVLDCEGINFVDSQGVAKLLEIAELAEESAITLRLARLKASVRKTLERDAVLERIGPDHVHGSVFQAVQAQLSVTSRRPEGS